MKKLFLLSIIILIIPSFIFSATTKKEINGEITGITPQKIFIFIEAEEEMKEGEEIKIIRGENIIAELKVTKIQGKIIEAEILTQYEDIDFSDKVIKEVEVEIPQEEVSEQKPEETKPEEKITEEKPKSEEITETKPVEKKIEETIKPEKKKEEITTEQPYYGGYNYDYFYYY